MNKINRPSPEETEKHYAISKETANSYISNWNASNNCLVPSAANDAPANSIKIDSFVFSIDDFKNFIARVDSDPNSANITGVVCRIGLKPNPIGPTNELVPCLVFEAVDGFDASLNPPTPGTSQGDLIPLPSSGSKESSSSARYDFSYPCPPTCPTT